jgi:hypothetical protein
LQQREAIQARLGGHRRRFGAQAQGLLEARAVGLVRLALRALHVVDGGQQHLAHLAVRLHAAQQRQQAVEQEDGAGAGVGQLVAQFAGGVLRIGVHQHHAGLQCAEGGDGVLQAVGQHQRQAVARLQAGMVAQVAGEGVGLALQLGEAQVAVATGERLALGELATGVAQQVVEVLIGVAGNLAGHMAGRLGGHRLLRTVSGPGWAPDFELLFCTAKHRVEIDGMR